MTGRFKHFDARSDRSYRLVLAYADALAARGGYGSVHRRHYQPGGPIPVFGGIAVGPVTVLAKGQHQLTAIFTPTNPSKFTPSTSNKVTFTF